MSGFVSGDGSFEINISKNSSSTLKERVSLRFIITYKRCRINEKYSNLLTPPLRGPGGSTNEIKDAV